MKRLPAIKVRIKDLIEGRFFYGEKESLKPSYLITRYGIKVARAVIVGTITDKFVSDDESYVFYLLDDGTGELRVKFFKELAKKNSNYDIGDNVVVIGKVREYLGEIYLNGEIIRKIEDPNFETLHKLEVVKAINNQKKLIKEIKSMREKMSEEEFQNYISSLGLEKDVVDVMLKYSEVSTVDYKERLIYLISELDEGDGVDIEKILEVTNLPSEIIESAISQLLDEGYIYEPSPGKFKMVKK